MFPINYKRNKATLYLLPLLKLNVSTSIKVIEVYIDNVFDPVNEYGDYLFVLFQGLSSEDKQYLRSHPSYSKSYKYIDGDMYKFYIEEEHKKSIIKPFVKGQYSKISKDYVINHFGMFMYQNDRIVVNPLREILDKSSKFKKKLEKYLSVEGNKTIIPKDNELDSKPDILRETYSTYKHAKDESSKAVEQDNWDT